MTLVSSYVSTSRTTDPKAMSENAFSNAKKITSLLHVSTESFNISKERQPLPATARK